MSKLLYVLKLNLFQDQFHLTKHKTLACLEFVLFVTLLYVKVWIKCSYSSDAPLNDLAFIQSLKEYRIVNETVSEAPLAAMQRHMWYLSQELTPFGLFSDSVSVQMKREMAVGLLKEESDPDTYERLVKYCGREDINGKTLDYFIGPSSHLFFKVLNLNTDFLSQDADTWQKSESFQEAKRIVQSLKVVNDSAERAIALASDFNSSFTRREDEKQILYQVVEEHRKRYPKANKSTFLAQLQ